MCVSRASLVVMVVEDACIDVISPRGSRSMFTDRGPVDRPLTDRDRAILDFERTWWTDGGAKEPAIRAQFDLSATRYYQLLAEMLDTEAALAYEPLVVRRLRKLRDRRRRSRFIGPLVERPGR
jgi:hypothetical protein